MRLTYFGHSAFQIDVGATTILLDPFITGNRFAERVVSPDTLNPDYVLLTHAHGDHFGDTPGILKRSGATVVANHEIVQYLERVHGHDKAVGMNSGGSWSFEWGRVRNTWARHSSSFADGTYGGNPGGFMIEADDSCVYAMGDTSEFHEMNWLGEEFDIDIALMPIGDCYTMGLRGSLNAARMLKPHLIIPTHYNTFEAIEVDVDEWNTSMNDQGFSTRIMEPGATFEL